MELIENLLQLLVTFAGACLAGFAYWKSRAQKYFLLFCFYGCFALGALYWTLYLLLFGATPRVFYVSEFGWVASMIFLRILQATLSGPDERAFRCRVVWLAPLVGVPLMVFYCTYGDILSNLIWCGMMIALSFCSIRGLAYARRQTGAARDMRHFHTAVLCFAASDVYKRQGGGGDEAAAAGVLPAGIRAGGGADQARRDHSGAFLRHL